MRNGNLFFVTINYSIFKSSYPTYEEWKPAFFNTIIFYFGVPVLILPMRNGNDNIYNKPLFNIRVLILPMRNGN